MELSWFVALSAILFSIGLLGVLTQKTAIRILFSVELILNSANINFVAFNSYLQNTATGTVTNEYMGWIFAMVVIALAAAEAAVGLAIFISLYRNFKEIAMVNIFELAESQEEE